MNASQTIERVAWQAYADACLEHDGGHARRAAAEVSSLRSVPPQGDTRSSEGGRTLTG